MTEQARAIGVDACKKGWVGISSDRRGYFGRTIDEVVAAADLDGRVDVTAIDIPIGLPSSTSRQADHLARRLIGKRASSVFSTPVRAALSASTHAEATAINLEATGKGLSQQAYALGKKILEVDAWARSAHRIVIEVHPEVSFATAAGRLLLHPKSTWSGIEERRRILESIGFDAPHDIGAAGAMAGVDDVLDAAIASWTAVRHAHGRAVPHPNPPEVFDDGLVAAIWA